MDTLPEYRNKTYESNRIRYVGNQTLGEYLVKETSNISNVESYFRKLINTHNTLLKGISMLNAADILHFDIKENNIMCRKKSGAPVIIDFGISIDTSKLSDTTVPTQDAFFSYTTNYEPWCLDIAMVSYMTHKTQNAEVEQPTINAWRNNNASIDEMNEVIHEFVDKNPVINGLLSQDELNIYKESMQTYYTPLVDGGMFNVPMWGNVYDELVKYHRSWDNYSVAVMFLRLLTQLGITEHAKEFRFMENYISILKSIVMSPPDKRPTATETTVELKSALSKITRKSKAKLGKLLTPEFQNREKYNARYQQISQSKKESIRVDDNLLMKKEKNIQQLRKLHEKVDGADE
jgi:serine/threonine protein kinase